MLLSVWGGQKVGLAAPSLPAAPSDCSIFLTIDATHSAGQGGLGAHGSDAQSEPKWSVWLEKTEAWRISVEALVVFFATAASSPQRR